MLLPALPTLGWKGRSPPREVPAPPHEVHARTASRSTASPEEDANRMSHRALHLAAVAVLVLGAGAAGPSRAQVTATSVTLAWTAPGDDSLTGQAARYDLRWSLTPIGTPAQFDLATAVPNPPLPQPAGAAESATVTGLTPQTTYWFALRTLDESGNASALSNVISLTTLVSSDSIRPAPVPLALAGTTTTSATVSWNDAGDDSLNGVASETEIRWATSPVTAATWATANVVFDVPPPGPPGTAQQLTVPDLDRTRDLWFAARARDDVNHVSALAPVLLVPHLLDTAPPATPGGLGASVESGPNVRLHWTANSEPDLVGYHVYRALAPSALYSRLTTTPVATNEFLDTTPPDTVSLWYEVSAVDATGNESARSAAYRVFLRGNGIATWSVAIPFPNPSRITSSVTLPIEVPAAGPYNATVEIQDSAGQHVRTLTLANITPGAYALSWDGRNDAGRATVPGVYRAWLKAGDRRQLVRFVRMP